MNVTQFLSGQGVQYQTLPHRPTFDAQRMAQAVHVKGDNVAKTVALRADGRDVLAVLQATHHVDLDAVRDLLGVASVDLATERELAHKFPDCELGALAAVWARSTECGRWSTARWPATKRSCSKGTRTEEAVRLRFDDYVRLEHPMVASFTHCG